MHKQQRIIANNGTSFTYTLDQLVGKFVTLQNSEEIQYSMFFPLYQLAFMTPLLGQAITPTNADMFKLFLVTQLKICQRWFGQWLRWRPGEVSRHYTDRWWAVLLIHLRHHALMGSIYMGIEHGFVHNSLTTCWQFPSTTTSDGSDITAHTAWKNETLSSTNYVAVRIKTIKLLNSFMSIATCLLF